MKRFDTYIGSADAALEETPEVLKGIGVNLPIHVLDSMVNHLVRIVSGQSLIGEQEVGIESGSRLNMLPDFGLQNRLAAAGHNDSADVPTALQDAHDGHFVFGASTGDAPLPFGDMHVASLAANEGLIHFNRATVAAPLQERAILHGKTNAVKHEPCSLLSDPKGPGDLAGANAILRRGDDPNGRKPLVQSERRVLEDGPNLDGELALGMGTLALKFPLCSEVANISPSASRASHSVRLAMSDHVAEALIRVCEVDDGFLKSGWSFHESRIGQLGV
jgi:hypothetical protein